MLQHVLELFLSVINCWHSFLSEYRARVEIKWLHIIEIIFCLEYIASNSKHHPSKPESSIEAEYIDSCTMHIVKMNLTKRLMISHATCLPPERKLTRAWSLQ